jgi:hypothetical protein
MDSKLHYLASSHRHLYLPLQAGRVGFFGHLPTWSLGSSLSGTSGPNFSARRLTRRAKRTGEPSSSPRESPRLLLLNPCTVP